MQRSAFFCELQIGNQVLVIKISIYSSLTNQRKKLQNWFQNTDTFMISLKVSKFLKFVILIFL